MVRVRFAPSPTGPLHMGGVRTALYNYLFAKKMGGKFILRIEDTDQTRFVPGAEAYIIEALEWCGIQFDEGVHIGGPHSPYKQSERKALYKQYVDKLIADGNAYYAFETGEELDSIRKKFESEKKTFQYDCNSRKSLLNSLNMPIEEVNRRIENGDSYVIRLKVPEAEVVELNDIIRGHVTVKTENIDDKVLFKSDGLPTYHLANIVDDHLMEITHVIRGEEWLPSAPLHVLLYRFLGWDAPQFAHLPLLLKPDGNGKLSKRDGDRLGFPVFPLRWQDPKTNEISSGYREAGYFPDAFVNMLAFLGWNPGDEREIMSIDELIEAFSLDRVSKSGAKFDPEKTKWFNHQYLQKNEITELLPLYVALLNEKSVSAPAEKLSHILNLTKERVNFIHELWDQTYFFFHAPESFDEQVIKKHWTIETNQWMMDLAEILEGNVEWEPTILENCVKQFIEERAIPAGKVFNSMRLALVGASKGPHLFDIMDVIGKSESLNRLRKAAEKIRV